MIELILFSAIICISYGIGKLFINLLIKKTDNLIEDFVFSTGLGLGIIGYLVYILGSAGFLFLNYTVAILSICAILAFDPFLKFVRRINYGNIAKSIVDLSGFEKFLILIITAISVTCFFGAKAPEIGNDALAYHLYHPKIFIQNHQIGYIPFTRESLWPYFTEMLFTLGLIFKSVSLAKMFHFAFGILSMLAVYSFVRRFFSKKEALLASALFYSAPGIFMQSVYAYVDLSLCFYSFAAFYALMLWAEQNEEKGLLMLSGIFTGLALSVKILGGITLITLCGILMLIFIFEKRKQLSFFKCFCIFLISTFIVSFVWYIRSYIVLHNPVYPFLGSIFKSGRHHELPMGVQKDIIGFLRLPWDIVMNIEYFGGEQIGVIFLAFLPCIFFVPLRHRVIKYFFSFLLIYTVVWFCVIQNIRYMFTNFTIIFSLISIGFYYLIEKYNNHILRLLLCLCISFNVSLCFYYNRDAIKLAFGGIKEEAYLSKKERTYAFSRLVNSHVEKDALVLFLGEPRSLYFKSRCVFYPLVKMLKGEDEALRIFKEFQRDYKDIYLVTLNDNMDDFFRDILRNKTPLFLSSYVEDHKQFIYRLYKL